MNKPPSDWFIAEQTLKMIQDNITLADQQSVNHYLPAKNLKQTLDLKFPKQGLKAEDFLKQIQTYIRHTVKTHHPYFANQLWSGFSYPSFIAEMITAAFNTSMYTYETAPIATLIEQEVIQKCLNLASFTDGEGIFTSGGSASNLSALLAARNHFNNTIAYKGLTSSALRFFVSKDCHYSFAKAANVLGLGIDNMIKVNTTDDGKMDTVHLEKCIRECLKEGSQPFFVSATTGTTVRGAYDDIPSIADITEKHNLWLHVDGAWGGSALWHSEHKNLLRGLERADSFAWDAHKVLGLPLMCAMLLFKNKGMLQVAHTHGKGARYIFRESEADHNLGPTSIQCGRKVDALKLYLTWQYLGDDGLEAYIDNLFKQAQYFAKIVDAHPNCKLYGPVESLNVCFQYQPSVIDKKYYDKLNLDIRTRLLEEGKVMTNYAYVNGDLIIRHILANTQCTHQHLDQLLEMVVKTGDLLSNEIN